ncbi:hypothetical protein Desaci_3780 [Desulfosporosinus acidiphilus SJ4]|uniref:Uncharacterized protein n=1 Tax=Desulfosporosinus acidiphilus (strain DSM 22704 / JCM 16185 / SJ4) TaxID=646529 RepID=I4DA37_DESAJ|nr:hypothetical protein [Desulfosporosinus acidiphilus]AFM42661.1 hypothetical protein Desaci_3780 [Desulfosporosinus acidiphilus SJ4]
MSYSLNEKWLIEEGAAQALVKLLNSQQGKEYKIVQHADRPDIVIENLQDGSRLGVEVTHLFYDSEEARAIFGRSHAQSHPPEYIEEYIRRLNALLQQKSEKAKGYCHQDPLALLIRVVSPIFHMLDFELYASRIIVPPSDFKIIWLLFYDFRERDWTLLERLR